jgi:hypothetical protein
METRKDVPRLSQRRLRRPDLEARAGIGALAAEEINGFRSVWHGGTNASIVLQVTSRIRVRDGSDSSLLGGASRLELQHFHRDA